MSSHHRSSSPTRRALVASMRPKSPRSSPAPPGLRATRRFEPFELKPLSLFPVGGPAPAGLAPGGRDESYTSQHLSTMTSIAACFTPTGVVKRIEPVDTVFPPDIAFHSHHEPIFSHLDINRILDVDITTVRNAGSTGVRIFYNAPDFNYHFVEYSWPKLQRYTELSKHNAVIHALSRLWHLIRDETGLPTLMLDHIRTWRPDTMLPAFRSYVTVRDLSCLLDEQYAWDDVINALLEVQYYQLASRTGSRVSPWLLINTHVSGVIFDRDIKSPLVDDQLLRELKYRLEDPAVHGIVFLHIESGHFRSYSYEKANGIIGRFDSLGLSGPKKHINCIKRFVRNVPGCPEPDTVEDLTDVLQPSDSGSCGFIVLNFIARYTGLSNALWCHSQSRSIRAAYLAKLCLWNTCQQDALNVSRHSSVPNQGPNVTCFQDFCPEIIETDLRRQQAGVCDDFNLWRPTVS